MALVPLPTEIWVILKERVLAEQNTKCNEKKWHLIMKLQGYSSAWFSNQVILCPAPSAVELVSRGLGVLFAGLGFRLGS